MVESRGHHREVLLVSVNSDESQKSLKTQKRSAPCFQQKLRTLNNRKTNTGRLQGYVSLVGVENFNRQKRSHLYKNSLSTN